jgi:hypothetical protein
MGDDGNDIDERRGVEGTDGGVSISSSSLLVGVWSPSPALLLFDKVLLVSMGDGA